MTILQNILYTQSIFVLVPCLSKTCAYNWNIKLIGGQLPFRLAQVFLKVVATAWPVSLVSSTSIILELESGIDIPRQYICMITSSIKNKQSQGNTLFIHHMSILPYLTWSKPQVLSWLIPQWWQDKPVNLNPLNLNHPNLTSNDNNVY